MRSYLVYYLLWVAAAYVVREPWLLLGVVVFFALRDRIPDPTALLRTLGYARRLEQRLHINPKDATARRELARVYLDVRRNARALEVLEAAPNAGVVDPELDFLLGLARHRLGRHEAALDPLVRSVEARAIRYGEPYLVAGHALFALGRLDAALDAYEHYAEINRSDVAVHLALARVHHRLGDRTGARASIDAAFETWRTIPGTLRRKNARRWLEGQWLRATILRDAKVIVVGLASLVVVAIGTTFAIAMLPRAFARARSAAMLAVMQPAMGGPDAQDLAGDPYAQYGQDIIEATAYCGTERMTPIGLGAYRVVFDGGVGASEDRLVVLEDRIRIGSHRIICPTHVRSRTASTLVVDAIAFPEGWDGDPGDAALMALTLAVDGGGVRLSYRDLDPGAESPTVTVTLARIE